MKLRDLKDLLNSLADKDLEKELIYNSKKYTISGLVNEVKVQKINLYYTGEDDPARLYTKKQLEEIGYDEDEIEGMEIEIKKGSVVVNF